MLLSQGWSVQAAMSGRVDTNHPGVSLHEAARRMVGAGITALCVTEPPARLVGILALDDILRAPRGRSLVASDRLADNVQAWPGLRVDQVMRRRVATIDPGRREMVNRELQRLPVVEAGQLVGVISEADIVSLLLGREPVSV